MRLFSPRDDRRPRAVAVALAMAAVTIITVDATAGDDSPVDPLRSAGGEVFGPVESGLDEATRPIEAVADQVTTVDGLRDDNARLQAENDRLRAELETAGIDRARIDALAEMTRFGDQHGVDLVTAQVIAMGPAQSFSQAVTIDAGTADGVESDMTVLNDQGLVGRVLRADLHTATVLLIVDASSVVGGRLGTDLELGMLRGDGELSDVGRLTLTTMDPTVEPATGDIVVTWGSRGGTPYVAGVPIGRIESVESSPRDQSSSARVVPYVDFSALDLVGVVIGASPPGDRTERAAPGEGR
ncbi:MAG: rod shape-determining protein MreC [Nocardioidaceae bacterium]